MTVDSTTEYPARPAVITETSRRYPLFVLFVAYAFSYLDRQIVAILQDPIKRDLGLNDAPLGLFSGFSFALFCAASRTVTLDMPRTT